MTNQENKINPHALPSQAYDEYFTPPTNQEIQKVRERIAKCLYEQEFSAGYWDTRMSKGDKIRWLSKADQILADPSILVKDPDHDEKIRENERERLKIELRQHWTEYDTTKKPEWVRATISGTQKFIENVLGKPAG